MAGTFWKDTVDFLITGMGTDLFAKSANLITHIAPLFSAGFGIYFMIIILNAYNRGFDGNAVDLAKKTAAWLLIIACAFNAGQYNHLANMLYEMPEWLASLFGGNFEASALDNAWDSIMQVIENIMSQSSSGWPNPIEKLMAWLVAGTIILVGGLFFGMVTAYYLVAKLSLAMVILIGPLFLGMMLFESTRQYAMNWISQILNYAVTVAFFTILMSFQMQFFQNHIEKAFTENSWETSMQLLGILPMFIVSTLIFVVVALNIPSITSALTGGASTGGFSNMVNFVKNTLNRGKDSNPISGLGAGKAYRQARALMGKAGNYISKR